MLAERLWPCLIEERRPDTVISFMVSGDLASEAIYSVRRTMALLGELTPSSAF